MPESPRRKAVIRGTAAAAAALTAACLIYACSDHVVACLKRYSKPLLAPADVRNFIEQGMGECFARGNPGKVLKQAEHLPFSLGTDARNGKTVEVVYTCFDICPASGGAYLRYAGMPENDCCASGGVPLHNWMTLYLGCSPPEAAPVLPPHYLPRYPGGPQELATQSPCDPTKIRFEDGSVVERGQHHQ